MRINVRKIIMVILGCLFWIDGHGAVQDDGDLLRERIRGEVQQFIMERITADSFDVRIEMSASIGSGIDNGDVKEVRIDWRRGREDLIGKVIIPVCLILQGGGTYATTYSMAMVRLFDRVLVTRVLMNRHHVPVESDVQKEMREVTGLKGAAFKDVESLLDRRVTRVIGRGRIITDNMIESLPLICRGDRVQLVLMHRNLRVTTAGYARADGWLGDRIRVRSEKTQREILGRVIGSNEVEVQL